VRAHGERAVARPHRAEQEDDGLVGGDAQVLDLARTEAVAHAEAADHDPGDAPVIGPRGKAEADLVPSRRGVDGGDHQARIALVPVDVVHRRPVPGLGPLNPAP
jgi:hypothetical protein